MTQGSVETRMLRHKILQVKEMGQNNSVYVIASRVFGIKFIVQGRYQGVLYFQNVIFCNGIREHVILFTPIIQAWSTLCLFSRYSQIISSIIFRSLALNVFQIEKINVRNCGYIKYRTSPVPNFYRNRARSVENTRKAGFLLRRLKREKPTRCN